MKARPEDEQLDPALTPELRTVIRPRTGWPVAVALLLGAGLLAAAVASAWSVFASLW